MVVTISVLVVIFAALYVHTEASCTYHASRKRGIRSAEPNFRARRSVTCSSTAPYRNIDGTCNNLNNPEWGSTGTEFLRLQDPVYNDNIGTPRQQAEDGSDLPNPRTISNNVHFELSFLSRRHTSMLMQWGQFIDHDITKTPQENDGDTDCCSSTESVLTNSSSSCYPIKLPNGDSYFDDGKCINLVRSAAYPGTGSSTSNKRQQYNSLTAFIDGSMIYGTSDSETDSLRDKSSNSGLLKVHNSNFLPNGSNDDCFLNTSDSSNYCFLAGDSRVNAFFGLGAMQTLFLREHNRIAAALKTINSNWDDETLFQETRRIVAAELQAITYNEFLPEILGNEAINNYNLGQGQYSYNSSLNPSLTNVFATAAFRYGHSQVKANFTIGSELYDTSLLFKRTKYVLNGMDDVIESLLTEAGQRADAWYVDAMRNQMFESDSAAKDGDDIVSLNIQRGRDHGLKPYNEWRDYCGLGKITSFTSGNDFGIIQARDLEDTYNDVDDIDMYSGGIAEAPVTGASVGRTYICLLGEQFKKLRDGDRFWYETDDSVVGFTSNQITQIERQVLAKIICDNTGVTSIQRNVFRLEGGNNQRQNCTDFRNMNLNRWRE